jgi:hypothetical protein
VASGDHTVGSHQFLVETVSMLGRKNSHVGCNEDPESPA